MTSVFLLNYRSAPSVLAQPTVDIRRWQIVKTTLGEMLLVGVLSNRFTWRVTTAIVAFCATTHWVTTQSGRKYELVGPPALDALDLMVIDARLAMNRISRVENVSDSYTQAMAGATQ